MTKTTKFLLPVLGSVIFMALVLAITNELNSRLLEKHRSEKHRPERVFGQIHGQDFIIQQELWKLKIIILKSYA